SHNITDDIQPTRLRQFFSKTDRGYQIHKSVRDLCIFARHDVTKDPPFSKIDIVSCRNLLIYFGPALQRRVVPIFHYALNSNGYLILGSTETIGGFSDFFFPADRKHKIYSKKFVPSRIHFAISDHTVDREEGKGKQEERVKDISEKDILKEGD